MISHLIFDPRESSYQFLYEIATFDQNPDNLAEIYEVITTIELRASDANFAEFTMYDVDCSAYGVKEALATNDFTDCDTMLKLAAEQDELLRAIIAARTKYDEVIKFLLEDKYVYTLKNLLENKYLQKKHYDRIVERFQKNEIDFSAPYNKSKEISKKMFAKFLKNHRFALNY